MKISKIMIVSLLLLAVMTLGAVSATDELTANETQDSLELSVDDADIITDDDIGGEILSDDEKEDVEYEDPYLPDVRAGPEYSYEEYYDDFNFRISFYAEGDYSILVDGDEVNSGTVDYDDIEFDLSTLDLTYGIHDLKFIYSGDDGHNGFTYEDQFEYYYFKVTVPENVTLGDWYNDRILCYIAKDLEGDLTVLINGEEFYKESIRDAVYNEDEDHYSISFNVPLDGLDFGEYDYTITYSGDENWENFTKKGSFVVDGYLFDVNNNEIDDDNTIYYGDELTFDIYLPADACENVTLIANGQEYVIELDDGNAYYDFSDLKCGENNLTFTYEDSKYPKKTVNYIFEVMGRINVPEEYYIAYNSGANINITLPKDAKGNLKVYAYEYDGEDYVIGDEIASVALVDGKAQIPISTWALGTYELFVTYDGEDYGVVDEELGRYVIPDVNYPKGIWTESEDPYKVIVTSPSDALGDLTVSIYTAIDDEDYLEPDEFICEIYANKAKGVVEVELPDDLEIGTYALSVDYSEEYDSLTKYYYIRVDDVDPNWEIEVDIPEVLVKYYEDDNFLDYRPNNLPDGIDGLLEFFVDGEWKGDCELNDYGDDFEVGYGSLSFGNHTWELKYSQGSYYLPTSVSGTFEVSFANIPDVVTPDYNIFIDLGYQYEGKVTFYLNGTKVYQGDLDYGQCEIELDLKLYETYDYKLVYAGDDEHDGITLSGSFYVSYPFRAYFAGEDYYSPYSKSYDLFIELPEDAYGNVTVIVDDKEYEADVEEGRACVSLEDLERDNSYPVTVKYSGYGNYTADEITVTIDIGGFAIVGSYSDDDDEDDEDEKLESVSLSMPEDASGNLIVENNGEVYKTAALDDGFAEIDLTDLPLGYNRIHAYYDGDDYDEYDEFWQTIKLLPEMEVYDELVSEDEDCTIEIELPGAKGQVAIYVDGDLNLTCDVVDGKVSAAISNLYGDEHVITFRYIGDEYYMLFVDYYDEDSGDIEYHEWWVFSGEKERSTPAINITYGEAVEGDEVSVTIEIPGATGSVIVNGEKYNLTDGKAVITVKDLVAGDLTIKGNYTGDDNFAEALIYKNIEVIPKRDAGLKVTGDAIKVGENATVSIQINKDATGKVTVDGKEVTIKDGKATYTMSNLAVGNHTVTVNFAGDKYFRAAKKTALIQVSKVELDPAVDPFAQDDNSGSNNPTYSIELPSDATGNLTVTVGNKTVTKELKDGKATVEVTDLPAGDYEAVVTYSGDDKYAPITKTENATVKVDPRIEAANVKALYLAGGKYQVTVYGDDGKAAANADVAFKVNGALFANVKTDENGTAAFDITQIPGTYTVVAEALGVSGSSKLTVKHVLKLKKVKVKRSAKKIVLTATLKKVNGKYLKKVKVTFRFNGKKFKKVKTNKKGVAKLTVKAKYLKNLKVGKKVKYQATYKKDTVKVKVKVKK
ncbi:Ig-like domain repeat protein [Methanobrevibacter sp.]|uniref:Ig-like domain repeat protein n=1 Tax=Methanobrevibacter sp. TaxID=66852 RepID=UPI00388FDB10